MRDIRFLGAGSIFKRDVLDTWILQIRGFYPSAGDITPLSDQNYYVME